MLLKPKSWSWMWWQPLISQDIAELDLRETWWETTTDRIKWKMKKKYIYKYISTVLSIKLIDIYNNIDGVLLPHRIILWLVLWLFATGLWLSTGNISKMVDPISHLYKKMGKYHPGWKISKFAFKVFKSKLGKLCHIAVLHDSVAWTCVQCQRSTVFFMQWGLINSMEIRGLMSCNTSDWQFMLFFFCFFLISHDHNLLAVHPLWQKQQ